MADEDVSGSSSRLVRRWPLLLSSVVAGVLVVGLVLAGMMWLSGSEEPGQPQAADAPEPVE
ncbi:hypothetical protein, partial [Haloechinothrix sp. LS1_15]|uniref:hypothetical protein n=1 Tax=Haloechinothrix sp. LS1_15 TaxID=2652248 RepID=UPI0029476EB9